METSELRRLELKAERVRSIIRAGEHKAQLVTQRLERERCRYEEAISGFSLLKKKLLGTVKQENTPMAALERLERGAHQLGKVKQLLSEREKQIVILGTEQSQILRQIEREKLALTSVEAMLCEGQLVQKRADENQQAEFLAELATAKKASQSTSLEDGKERDYQEERVSDRDAEQAPGDVLTDCAYEEFAPMNDGSSADNGPESFSQQHGGNHSSGQHNSHHNTDPMCQPTPAAYAKEAIPMPTTVMERIKNLVVSATSLARTVSFSYTAETGGQINLSLEALSSGGVAITLRPEEAGTARRLRAQMRSLLESLRLAGVRVIDLRIEPNAGAPGGTAWKV